MASTGTWVGRNDPWRDQHGATRVLVRGVISNPRHHHSAPMGFPPPGSSVVVPPPPPSRNTTSSIPIPVVPQPMANQRTPARDFHLDPDVAAHAWVRDHSRDEEVIPAEAQSVGEEQSLKGQRYERRGGWMGRRTVFTSRVTRSVVSYRSRSYGSR